MHPLAATLALHGCGIFRYDNGHVQGYAVAHLPLIPIAVELWFGDYEGMPRITGVSREAKNYLAVSWDAVPYERWGEVDKRTMDAFLERL
ncbi:TPA: hypothetical protein QDE31_37590 [Burkholderia cenocepacia]|nr:hypothetical protein [Burkholderia cenocepacia]HDR9875420.1 hypothetical protein [Burkholderia cenocepacia]